MEFLQNNWFWIILAVFFIWMHASGVGCGGSGKHGRGKHTKKAEIINIKACARLTEWGIRREEADIRCCQKRNTPRYAY